MDRRIKLRHLEVFATVARAGSLKRAAEVLNLTQPGVSKTLRELEEITGHALADRSRAGLRLTPEGEVFLLYADQSTTAIRQGLHRLQAPGASGGQLRIGALPSVAATLLPPAVRAFVTAQPDTQIEITEGAHQDLTNRLRAGGLDLVIGRLGRPDSMIGLSFRHLHSEEVVVVARPDSLAQRAPSLAALADFRVLYPPRDSAIRPLVARLLIAQGVPLYPQRIESASSAFGRALTLAHADTVWFISRGVVENDIARGDLLALPLNTDATRGAVGIMTRADEVPTAPLRAFVRALGEAQRHQAPE